MNDTFKALLVTEHPDGSISRAFAQRSFSELPVGEILVKISHAALNYKDGLSATGHKGITRKLPHTPGIDGVGVVAESSSPAFFVGQEVVVNSYDIGMNHWGCFGEYVRVPAGWVMPLPEGMSRLKAVTLGVAGFTAALALQKMENSGQKPDMGPVLVTGSTGGVGSFAVAILAKAGYEVIATTGKETSHDYLRKLGAHRIEPRSFANDVSGRPLLKALWAGAIDTVGDNTLATCLKACKKEGCVAATGLVESHNLSMTVYPFLLNGVNLLGVDSAEYPMNKRQAVWERLATDWNLGQTLNDIRVDTTLETLNTRFIPMILEGKVQGRVVATL